MARVRVKICGVTAPEIGVAAAEAGADAIGLVFAPSRRRVTVEQAERIVAALPPFVAPVGVFVDATVREIDQVAVHLRLAAVQLHGNEPPDLCARLRSGRSVIKAVAVRGAMDREAIAAYRGSVDAVLLDAPGDEYAGGAGRPFDWAAVRSAALGIPVIISGGLTPENVERAMEIFRPYGVDVSSGVETGGRKDPEKIRRFVEQVRRWDQVEAGR